MEARKVELLEKRPGYDTTWKISTDMGIFRIHRRDAGASYHARCSVAESAGSDCPRPARKDILRLIFLKEETEK